MKSIVYLFLGSTHYFLDILKKGKMVHFDFYPPAYVPKYVQPTYYLLASLPAYLPSVPACLSDLPAYLALHCTVQVFNKIMMMVK